jgi:hypothetical protein
MKLEQPGERSRFLHRPLTWAEQLRLSGITFPVLLISVALALEFAVIDWFIKPDGEKLWPKLLLAGPVLFAGLYLVLRFSLWADRNTKRSLDLREKWLGIHTGNYRRFPWDCVIAFQIEPVPGHPDLARVRVIGKLSRKSKLRLQRALILDRQTQLPALLAELNLRRQTHPDLLIQEFDEPLPERKPPVPRGLLVHFLSLILFLHGGPMLWIGCMLSGKPAAPTKHWSPPETPLERTVDRYFTSYEQVVRFFLVTGSLLTATGLVVFGWSCVVIHRSGKAIRAQAERDFLDDSARARSPA